jgi:hypothetical protein
MSSFSGDLLSLDDFESLGENFPGIEIELNFDYEVDKSEIPDILLQDIFFDTPISLEKSQEVHVRTHRGSGSRTITLDMLKRVGHLPQQKAADALKIGNTRFKTATRELGMSGWPYRKIKSIQNLIKIIEQHTKFFGEKESTSIIGAHPSSCKLLCNLFNY